MESREEAAIDCLFPISILILKGVGTADSEDVQCLLFEMSVIMMSFYGQEERKKEDSTKMTFTHIHCTQSSYFMFLPKPFERSG